MNAVDEDRLMRRVAGNHNFRLDGIGDLLMRARDASVMDIGCNRGQVAYDFALNGASKCCGCDIYEPGIRAAREWFTDLRKVESQFEVVDLRKPDALTVFPGDWDIVVMLATYHKLKREMPAADLSKLMQHVGRRTKKYFGWRATSDKPVENEQEMMQIDRDMQAVGLKNIHKSYISLQLGVAAIWARV